MLLFPVVLCNALFNYDDLRNLRVDDICIVDNNRLLMLNRNSESMNKYTEQLYNANVYNIVRSGFTYNMLDIRTLLTYGRGSYFYGNGKLTLSIISTGVLTFKVLFIVDGIGLIYEQIKVFDDEDDKVLPYVSITDRVRPAFINKRFENIVINKDVRNDIFKCHVMRSINEVNEFLRGCV